MNLNEKIDELDELLLFLFFKLRKNYNISLGKNDFKTQKLVFQIKMDLGQEHPFFDSLPFYWYIHGPFSQEVRGSFEIVKKYLNGHNKLKKEIYEEWENKEWNIVSKYPELEDKIFNLLKNDILDLDKTIYKEYAPYECIYPFKYLIYDFAIGKDYYITNFEEHINNRYIDNFYECESKLPTDKYFTEFSDIFSNLTTTLDLINEENKLINQFNKIRETIIYSWETFAKGLRVKKHDYSYNSEIEKWDREFNTYMKRLNSNVNSMEKLIDSNRDNIVYTPFQKKILKSTLGNYIKE